MTNWPGLMEVTALPTSSTMPQYSCPIGVGWGTGLIPRYGHKSEPHTHVAEFLTIASVGFRIAGVSRSSKRRSRGPYRTVPFIFASLKSSSSSSGVTAIHDQGMANHKTRLRAAQPKDGRGYLLRSTQSSDWLIS